LADNFGHLDCAVIAAHPAGNHTIFVAEVLSAAGGAHLSGTDSDGHGGRRPLLYFDRSYHHLD
jgi:flavin reductase (DIM6/NTAB) family NADH-FMN oxidoreductase RutF